MVVRSAAEQVLTVGWERRRVAEIRRKRGNSGSYWCGSHTVGSAPMRVVSQYPEQARWMYGGGDLFGEKGNFDFAGKLSLKR